MSISSTSAPQERNEPHRARKAVPKASRQRTLDNIVAPEDAAHSPAESKPQEQVQNNKQKTNKPQIGWEGGLRDPSSHPRPPKPRPVKKTQEVDDIVESSQVKDPRQPAAPAAEGTPSAENTAKQGRKPVQRERKQIDWSSGLRDPKSHPRPPKPRPRLQRQESRTKVDRKNIGAGQTSENATAEVQQDLREKAATRIQAVQRGGSVRKALQMTKVVSVLSDPGKKQKSWDGGLRDPDSHPRPPKPTPQEREHAAATRLQAAQRGRAVRKRLLVPKDPAKGRKQKSWEQGLRDPNSHPRPPKPDPEEMSQASSSAGQPFSIAVTAPKTAKQGQPFRSLEDELRDIGSPSTCGERSRDRDGKLPAEECDSGTVSPSWGSSHHGEVEVAGRSSIPSLTISETSQQQPQQLRQQQTAKDAQTAMSDEEAAVRIQAVQRGRMARKSVGVQTDVVLPKRRSMGTQMEDAAAACIQAVYRGRASRRSMGIQTDDRASRKSMGTQYSDGTAEAEACVASKSMGTQYSDKFAEAEAPVPSRSIATQYASSHVPPKSGLPSGTATGPPAALAARGTKEAGLASSTEGSGASQGQRVQATRQGKKVPRSPTDESIRRGGSTPGDGGSEDGSRFGFAGGPNNFAIGGFSWKRGEDKEAASGRDSESIHTPATHDEEHLRMELSDLRKDLKMAQNDLTNMALGFTGARCNFKPQLFSTTEVRPEQKSKVKAVGSPDRQAKGATRAPRSAGGTTSLTGSAPTVLNGGFEDGAFPRVAAGDAQSVSDDKASSGAVLGWLTSATAPGSKVFLVRNSDVASKGICAATGSSFVALRGDASAISQVVGPHTLGKRYQLRFQSAADKPVPDASFKVSVGGCDVGLVVPLTSAFSLHVVSYTPQSDAVEVRFENVGGNSDLTIFLDNVSVEEQPPREDTIQELFTKLDADGSEQLDKAKLKRYADLLGFEGGADEWSLQYHMLAASHGWDARKGASHTQFAQLVNDADGSGFCSTDELNEVLTSLNLDSCERLDPQEQEAEHSRKSPEVPGVLNGVEDLQLAPAPDSFPAALHDLQRRQAAQLSTRSSFGVVSSPSGLEVFGGDDVDLDHAPNLVLPWLAVHAPQPVERRTSLAVRAKEWSIKSEGKLPTAEQALTLVRWCWRYDRPWLAGWVMLPLLAQAPASLTMRWVSMLILFQLWRHAADGEGQEYLVDNSTLQVPTQGLGYRFSKQLEDVDGSKTAVWGSTVRGIDRSDGWLRVGNLFLPTELDGVTVLVALGNVPLSEERRRAAEAKPEGGETLDCAAGPDTPGLDDAPEEWVFPVSEASETLHVRSAPSQGAAVVTVKRKGVLLRGRSDGHWLALAGGEGYCQVREGDQVFLQCHGRDEAKQTSSSPLPPPPPPVKPKEDQDQLELRRLQRELVEQRARLEKAEQWRLEAEQVRRVRASDDVGGWDVRRNGNVLAEAQHRMLAQELKQEVKLTNDERRSLEDTLTRAKEAVALRQRRLRQELKDLQLRVSAAREREALGRDLKNVRSTSSGSSYGGIVGRMRTALVSSSEDLDPVLLGQLQAAIRSREDARNRAIKLRDDLRVAQRQVSAAASAATASQPPRSTRHLGGGNRSSPSNLPASAVHAVAAAAAAVGSGEAAMVRLGPLLEEVSQLSGQLSTLEGSASSPGGITERSFTASASPTPRPLEMPCDPVRFADIDQDLADRTQRLREDELALESERVQLRELASHEANRLLFAHRGGELASQLSDFGSAERELAARLAFKREECSALNSKYEMLQQRLFIYAAALLRRVPRQSARLESPPMHAGTSVPQGIEALIHFLAQRFGWPEVAFVHLDIRRRGRLNIEDFHLGLLLGLGVDYPHLTRLSINSLFSAFDRRKVGHISGADLGACCTGMWRSFGEKQPTPMEKLRALPYGAVGGAMASFAEAATARGLPWEPFEELVCHRLRGTSLEEARALFSALSVFGSGTAITAETWESATADVPETLARPSEKK